MAPLSNLGLKFREIARANAERPALRQTDGEITTYAQLDGLSNWLASVFLERGLRRGDVVGILH
ncbi:MAG: acyl-CoA synthetase, partial [Verrucomicrobia bacterium]